MNHKFMKQKKWNPINKRNMEDVYNREKKIEESNQKAKEKLATLQKERVTMEFEKMSDGSVTYAKDPRAWIQRLLPNSEATQRDQLLGKVEINLNTKNEDTIKTGMNIPGTSVSESNVSTSMNEASRRVHEDPLFLIQQEDMRNRQRLLQNPKTINLLKQKLSQLGYNQPNSHETTSQSTETQQNNKNQTTVNNHHNHHHSHHSHYHQDNNQHKQYNRHSSSNRSDSESSIHHSNRHRSRSTSHSYHHHPNDDNHDTNNTNTSLTSNNHNIKSQQSYYKRPTRSTHHMTEEEKQKQLEEMSKNAEINQELKNKRLLEGHKSDLQSQQEQSKHKEDFHHNPNFIQEFRKEAYMGNNKS